MQAKRCRADLVRSVHAPGDLLPEAQKFAREIADNTAPVSVALTRAMLWRLSAEAHPMAAHQHRQPRHLSPLSFGRCKEGISSFLEKRAPVYPDKVSTDLPDFFPWWDEPAYK